MKYLQQVSRNAFGGVRVIVREEITDADGTLRSVSHDQTYTDAPVTAAADALFAAVQTALGLDGLDPTYQPEVIEDVEVEAPEADPPNDPVL